MGVWWKVLSRTIGPFSLGLKTREVRNIVKLRWKLPSNCTKFHPKLCTKNRKSECDFSIVRNFARCFVMRTHTAGKSWFYSRDFRIGNGWSSKLGMRSSSRNFVIFLSELTSRVFGVMRIRSVKHRELIFMSRFFVMRMALMK